MKKIFNDTLISISSTIVLAIVAIGSALANPSDNEQLNSFIITLTIISGALSVYINYKSNRDSDLFKRLLNNLSYSIKPSKGIIGRVSKVIIQEGINRELHVSNSIHFGDHFTV